MRAEKDPKTGKAKTNGKIYSYITLRTYDPETDNGKPLKIIDLNSFPEIQDARFFEGTETQNVIYYATSTKIYSINLAIANPLVTLEYTAPEGEEITSMMAWNADADDKVIEVSNNNRMIVLSTYNPSSREGFVRTVAIATLGTGTLEKNRELHGEFGGFGRITATNIQKAF